jgi:uncharacterized FAD-dependent dehydrogenase
MYRINQVTLPIDFDKSNLADYVVKKLKVDKNKLSNVSLFRLSIDARDKNNLCYKAGIIFDYSLGLNISKFKNLELYNKENDEVVKWTGKKKKIVIVGSGPSGLFAGLRLAESGADVTIIERGYEMSKRQKSVEKLMNEGVLDT